MRSANIVVFLIFLNAAAALFMACDPGPCIAQDTGVEPDVGGGEEIGQVTNESQNVESDVGGVSGTWIGNVVAGARRVASMFSVVYAGPTMLNNLGVPGWLVTFVFAPMYIVVALDVLSVFTQQRIQS